MQFYAEQWVDIHPGDPVSRGESHNSEEPVIQLELFTLGILWVWFVGKIKDCQETDVSYGMSHLLKSCLQSSVQLCRPGPWVHVCVCVCGPLLPIHCCFSPLNGKDRGFKDDYVLNAVWDNQSEFERCFWVFLNFGKSLIGRFNCLVFELCKAKLSTSGPQLRKC